MRHLNGYVARRATWALSFCISIFYRFLLFFTWVSVASTINLVVLSSLLFLTRIQQTLTRHPKDRKNFPRFRLDRSKFCSSLSNLRVHVLRSFRSVLSRVSFPREHPGSVRGREYEREFYVSLVVSSPGTRNARHCVSLRNS